ncbi:MAG: helix-turn-helix transcriptional regulator, partial [Clostridia bacterium]|nr:helix-turn-helix transcriptional regulator [Clostridia bacterium]
TEKTNYVSQYEYIVRVMNEHCDEALTAQDIARLCNFSLSNLKKIFHMYSDIGIMKYFTSIKIRRALHLLFEGLTIQQVSDNLGFSSINYFHAVFKKETGLTPRQYLQKHSVTLR